MVPFRAGLHRLFLIILLSLSWSTVIAQDFDEVFLQFNYQGGVNTTVVAYYDSQNDRFLLPVTELFRQLLIPSSLDPSGMSVSGVFLNNRTPYTVNAKDFYVSLAGKRTQLTAEQVYMGELDLYLDAAVFFSVFELEFRVDFSNLMIRLVTPHKMPVVLRQDRLRLREQLERRRSSTRGQFPILFDRKRHWIDGGFLDYAYQQTVSKTSPLSNSLSFITGTELLAGDFQANGLISNRQGQRSVDISNYRWRYYFGDEPIVSQVFLGDVSAASGVLKSAYKGVRFTNQPLYSDRVYDYYTISEKTEPESEVELFVNERLIDFTVADAEGRFTFVVPILYGPNDMKVVIYRPGGEIIESNRQIRIPFNFVPKGQFQYEAGAGVDENAIANGMERFGYFRGGYGVSPKLSLGTSVELLGGPTGNDSFVAGTINSSLFDGLFLNAEIAPSNFYKSDVYYQNARNDFVNAYVSTYDPGSQMARTGLQTQMGSSVFYNVLTGDLPLSLRTSFDQSNYSTFSIRNISADMNTRLGKVSTRVGLRHTERNIGATSISQNRYNTSVTYTIPRGESVFLPFRGLYMRAQVDAINTISNLDRMDFAMSRSFLGNGRIQFNVTRVVPTQTTTFFLSLSFDFSAVRTSANTRVTNNFWTSNQSVRGAVAYEPQLNLLWFDNRGQVGRSAIIAKMFVDENDNGQYEKGEPEIRGNVLRIIGSSTKVKTVKGYQIFSQLSQYRQYDAEINKAFVENPTFAPAIDRFGIVTDPNQHKVIAVPFQMTGILEGLARRETPSGVLQELGGLRLYYLNLATNERREVISFFDGSFYAMEVPPGDYRMYPDSTQLDILKSDAHPAYIDFTIKSIPEGDFIAGLNFDLKLRVPPVDLPNVRPGTPVVAPVVSIAEAPQYFRIQTAMMSTLARAIMAKLDIEEKTGVTHEIQYNARWDNYRVFSTEIEGLDNALAAINALRKSQFSDAFIISEQIFASEDVFYAVQVGAFADSSDAVRHVTDIKERYALEGHIQFDALGDHFNVVLEPMSNFLTASTERDRVRRETGITDAFLITQPNVNARDIEFSVQFGVFDTQAQAFQLSQRLTNRQGVQNYVVQLGGKFSVRSRPTNRLEDAVELYRRARSLGYSDAIIHTYRS